jgi:F0F1-type ATP synthase assembly protein I
LAKATDTWLIALRLTGLGWYIATCMILGVLGGIGLDNLLVTKPLFILLGTLLGSVTAFWGLYKMVQPILKAAKGKGVNDQGRDG